MIRENGAERDSVAPTFSLAMQPSGQPSNTQRSDSSWRGNVVRLLLELLQRPSSSHSAPSAAAASGGSAPTAASPSTSTPTPTSSAGSSGARTGKVPPPPPDDPGARQPVQGACARDSHSGRAQISRGNQFGSWTVCTGCGLRSNYQSFSDRKLSWSHLTTPPPPPSWRRAAATTPLGHPKEKPASPDQYLVEFGKHKGKEYHKVYEVDQAYCFWVKAQARKGNCSQGLKDFAEYVETRDARKQAEEAASDSRSRASPQPRDPTGLMGDILRNMNDQALFELLSQLLAQRADLSPPPAEATTPAAPAPEEAAAAASAEEETVFPDTSEWFDMTMGDAVSSEVPTPLPEEIAYMMGQIQHPSATETTQNLGQALMTHLVGGPVVMTETAAVKEQEEQP